MPGAHNIVSIYGPSKKQVFLMSKDVAQISLFHCDDMHRKKQQENRNGFNHLQLIWPWSLFLVSVSGISLAICDILMCLTPGLFSSLHNIHFIFSTKMSLLFEQVWCFVNASHAGMNTVYVLFVFSNVKWPNISFKHYKFRFLVNRIYLHS